MRTFLVPSTFQDFEQRKINEYDNSCKLSSEGFHCSMLLVAVAGKYEIFSMGRPSQIPWDLEKEKKRNHKHQ